MKLKAPPRTRNSKSLTQVWRFRLMLFVLLVFTGVAMIGPATPVRPTAKAATFTVCAVGCDFTTIQAAVAAADATPENDIINVQAGTYSEIVTIPGTEANLVINGPNANIHACTGTRVAEAIVGNASGAFQILASNATVNGFTMQGNTNSAFLGAGVSIGAATSGVQLLNNIIQNNIVGIFLGGDNSTIQGNLIQNNNVVGSASGHGIYTDQFVAGGTLSNVLINDNCFVGHVGQTPGADGQAIGFSSTDVASPATGITISDNVFTGNGRAFYMFNVTSSSFTGNTVSGSTFAGSADLRIFEGVNGLTIQENSLTGGVADAVRISNAGTGLAIATNITITCNSITSYTGDGLEIGVSGYSGALNAVDNWWGSGTGPTIASNPGGTGETIVDPATQINYTPFLISGNDADPTAPGFQCGSLLVQGGATITMEGCLPSNGVVDPGETVTVSLCVTNNGNQATTNLVGTLQATGGVTSPSSPQNYGALQPSPLSGSTVCRDFTFTAANQVCGSTITATIQLQDGKADLGTVTYTFTLGVSDGMGGFVCCTPCTSITCPANLTQSNDPNQCGAVVNYPAPTSAGGCGTITCAPPAGSFFPVGTTTVTCTSTAGPTCTFTVTVNDTQPPSLTCPTNLVVVTPPACPASTVTTVTYTTPSATDNCPGVTVACLPPSGSAFPVGTTTITCTATDASGNTATCSFAVKVFNVCVQDRSNPAAVLAWNTSTGDYVFCCNGTTFTGIGQVKRTGCTYTLTHTPVDRRITGKVDFSTFRGEGSLQSPVGTSRCTISDNDVRNNDCSCIGGAAPPPPPKK